MVPFQLHGYGTDICMSNGPCFRRSSEIELHPYSVEGEMIFPIVCERLDRVLRSEYIYLLYSVVMVVVGIMVSFNNYVVALWLVLFDFELC